MPLFKFKVANAAGKIEEILIESESESEATRRVRSRSLIPIEFLGHGDSRGGRAWGLRRKFDVADFSDRLVPLLQADIPLERALGIIGETSESQEEKELVAGLRRGLHEGRKLSQLIRDRGRQFPRMYASIVEAGEEAGALPQVLAQLRDFLIMQREMRNFVVSSSIYPLFVLLVCGGVVTILLGIVVPKFGEVITTSGQPAVGSTALLLALSSGLHDYWWIGVILLAVAVIAVREASRDERILARWDEFVLKVPILGRMVLLANIGRLVRTMAILMRNGVHLLDTVAIAARVIQNSRLRGSISTMAADLRRGERLSVALGRSPYMPTMVIRMLAVGEEMGASDVMLERVADRYDADLKQLVKRALSWFEPIVIIVLGLVVGSIVLMLFLAVMDMQGGL
ncbi:MAG: type II secretion system F family protein [Lentisphaeria bacterium]|jgi:general secretion pathway protein F|nr:type II secretion system F family protein [Lentisphaeria bacterium]MDP7741406.1 type II secretion system F family protein [Lentisphaeria bacterium]